MKKESSENIVVYINYNSLYMCGNTNIKQFLDFLYDHPDHVTKSIALAIDNVRRFNYGSMDMKQVVLRFTNFN